MGIHSDYQKISVLIFIVSLMNVCHVQMTSDLRNDPCAVAPEDICEYRGICYLDDAATPPTFACHCTYPYGGKNCELPGM